jgi:hypothetical protein
MGDVRPARARAFHWLLAAAAALAPGMAPAQPAAVGALPASPAAPAAVASAPFCLPGFTSIKMTALASGHHSVAVTLNGKPAIFLVDTGAGATIIHAPYVRGFALAPAAGAGLASNASGKVRFDPVAVDAFAVGGTRTRLAKMYAMDLSYLVDAVSAASAHRIQGLIGQDVLRDQRAVIDVDQSLLYLANPDPAAGMTCGEPETAAVPFRQPRRSAL